MALPRFVPAGRTISDCKMQHARTLSWQPVAPFRAKRRAKRTLPSCREGDPGSSSTGWKENDRGEGGGEGSDVVNAERSVNVITRPGVFRRLEFEDSCSRDRKDLGLVNASI